ncbi:MAG: hypothetical protein WAU88_01155, partial [Candidatus Zixiibacteriota bacterium]
AIALWLQAGLIGLGGFCITIWFTIKNWYITWKQKSLSANERLMGALMMTLLLFYLVSGLIDTPYFKNDLALALWGVIGLSLSWGNLIRSKRSL